MSKYIHQYMVRKRFVTRLGVARASAGGGARPEQQTLLLGAALCVLARGLPQQALPALVPQPPLHLPLRLPQHLLQPCLQHLPNQNRQLDRHPDRRCHQQSLSLPLCPLNQSRLPCRRRHRQHCNRRHS